MLKYKNIVLILIFLHRKYRYGKRMIKETIEINNGSDTNNSLLINLKNTNKEQKITNLTTTIEHKVSIN